MVTLTSPVHSSLHQLALWRGVPRLLGAPALDTRAVESLETCL